MHKYKSALEFQNGQSEIIAFVSTKVNSKYVLAKIYHKKASTERNSEPSCQKMPQMFETTLSKLKCLRMSTEIPRL